MKVKANYGIGCEKGYFETGETFDIDAKDLPMYGDAVTVLDKAPEAKTEPAKEPETKAPVDSKVRNGGDTSSSRQARNGGDRTSRNGGDSPSSSGEAVTEGQSPCSEGQSPGSEAADTEPAEEKQAAPKRTTRKRA